ncbi:iron complex transport system ATP-binding protein [Enterococcus sp. DIV2402]|uniref:Iron complex transport system ATP-binding protein n=1 Tax=Candidatus Enterococcus lowellii TaxID=2230877 RepID=A0ABZ2SMY9_9ENTE|nr:ABC transporter ATP-binding protein [Enterococcus sp. DIV2402]MBO0465908.1 ABC transporter ATP-binding protein [Enterococcus sp. DIV2402]
MDLTVENIEVFLGTKKIINGIDLQVANHSFTALLGPNGSGKSTLLKSVYRVLEPKSGTIYLDDLKLKQIPTKEIAQRMSVVSQFQSNSFDFTVKEIVLMGRTPHLRALEKESSLDYQLVDEALEKTGLYDLKDRTISKLSGGEKQRVSLARAIVQNPTLMILDEPSNHLDIKYQLEILRVIKKLGVNALAALHDISLAAQFCDYIYFIKEGEIKYHGSPKEVITKEIIKDIYEVDCEVYEDSKTHNILISYYTS